MSARLEVKGNAYVSTSPDVRNVEAGKDWVYAMWLKTLGHQKKIAARRGAASGICRFPGLSCLSHIFSKHLPPLLLPVGIWETVMDFSSAIAASVSLRASSHNSPYNKPICTCYRATVIVLEVARSSSRVWNLNVCGWWWWPTYIEFLVYLGHIRNNNTDLRTAIPVCPVAVANWPEMYD